MNATRTAVRQVLYLALTNPVLAYTVEGAPRTVPAANVGSKRLWRLGGASAPMPLVSIAVETRATPGWSANERNFSVVINVVSADGEDDAEAIMEAIRARFHGADTEGIQDAVNRPADLSRAASGAALGVAIRRFREAAVPRSDYNVDEQRWYITAEYTLSAA